MSAAGEFLSVKPAGAARFELAMGEHLRGAFGGVFGGGVAAATLHAARSATPDRRPFSIHCTFLRTLTTPTQTAAVEVLSEGRTVTTVGVELHDAVGRLAAWATVTLVAPESIRDFAAAGPARAPDVSKFDEGWELPVPKGLVAPLMATLPMRITGMPEGGFAHAIRAPWPGHEDVAEAATMVADYCAGVPVGAAIGAQGTRVPVPNPDLSLRFTGDDWGELLVGVGRLARIDRGVAATLVEVWTGPDDAWTAGDDRCQLLAVGLSSAVMLAGAPEDGG